MNFKRFALYLLFAFLSCISVSHADLLYIEKGQNGLSLAFSSQSQDKKLLETILIESTSLPDNLAINLQPGIKEYEIASLSLRNTHLGKILTNADLVLKKKATEIFNEELENYYDEGMELDELDLNQVMPRFWIVIENAQILRIDVDEETSIYGFKSIPLKVNMEIKNLSKDSILYKIFQKVQERLSMEINTDEDFHQMREAIKSYLLGQSVKNLRDILPQADSSLWFETDMLNNYMGIYLSDEDMDSPISIGGLSISGPKNMYLKLVFPKPNQIDKDKILKEIKNRLKQLGEYVFLLNNAPGHIYNENPHKFKEVLMEGQPTDSNVVKLSPQEQQKLFRDMEKFFQQLAPEQKTSGNNGTYSNTMVLSKNSAPDYITKINNSTSKKKMPLIYRLAFWALIIRIALPNLPTYINKANNIINDAPVAIERTIIDFKGLFYVQGLNYAKDILMQEIEKQYKDKTVIKNKELELDRRIDEIDGIFWKLSITNSYNEKKAYIKQWLEKEKDIERIFDGNIVLNIYGYSASVYIVIYKVMGTITLEDSTGRKGRVKMVQCLSNKRNAVYGFHDTKDNTVVLLPDSKFIDIANDVMLLDKNKNAKKADRLSFWGGEQNFKLTVAGHELIHSMGKYDEEFFTYFWQIAYSPIPMNTLWEQYLLYLSNPDSLEGKAFQKIYSILQGLNVFGKDYDKVKWQLRNEFNARVKEYKKTHPDSQIPIFNIDKQVSSSYKGKFFNPFTLAYDILLYQVEKAEKGKTTPLSEYLNKKIDMNDLYEKIIEDMGVQTQDGILRAKKEGDFDILVGFIWWKINASGINTEDLDYYFRKNINTILTHAQQNENDLASLKQALAAAKNQAKKQIATLKGGSGGLNGWVNGDEHREVNDTIRKHLIQPTIIDNIKEEEIRFDFIGDLPVNVFIGSFSDNDFGHIGLTALQVYADSYASASHEIVELALWNKFAKEILGQNEEELKEQMEAKRRSFSSIDKELEHTTTPVKGLLRQWIDDNPSQASQIGDFFHRIALKAYERTNNGEEKGLAVGAKDLQQAMNAAEKVLAENISDIENFFDNIKNQTEIIQSTRFAKNRFSILKQAYGKNAFTDINNFVIPKDKRELLAKLLNEISSSQAITEEPILNVESGIDTAKGLSDTEQFLLKSIFIISNPKIDLQEKREMFAYAKHLFETQDVDVKKLIEALNAQDLLSIEETTPASPGKDMGGIDIEAIK